jgi:hypothetical protein
MRRALALSFVALAACVSSAGAQGPARVRLEGRLDLVHAKPSGRGEWSTTAVQGGFGGALTVSRYLRLALIGAAGTTFGPGAERSSGRIDAGARFVLDPEFLERWGTYVTVGLSLRREHDPDWRGYLATSLGLEGPRLGRVAPFFEIGYGGGTRLGVGLRQAPRGGGR